MSSERHVSDRLAAFLAGRLDEAQAASVVSHLASCADCASERDVLRDGLMLLGGAVDGEPRPGFAGRVALAAAEARPRPFATAWRWAFGGLAGAAVAAAAVLLVPSHAEVTEPSHEMLLAQRLELYEDLSVVQNRDALENLDVVESLDQLGSPEGKP